MTPPAAELPLAGAALRMTHMTRSVAGRRALRLALLVAGLFALGLLCGERAHAADGLVSTAPTVPTAPTSSSVRLVKPGAPLPVAHSVAHTVTRVTDTVTRTHVTDTVTHADVTDTVAQVGDTVTRVSDTVRHVVRPAADSVVRPVGDLVETVTGELGQAPPKTLPSLPSLPSPPSPPELPGPPSPPGAGVRFRPPTRGPSTRVRVPCPRRRARWCGTGTPGPSVRRTTGPPASVRTRTVSPCAASTGVWRRDRGPTVRHRPAIPRARRAVRLPSTAARRATAILMPSSLRVTGRRCGSCPALPRR